MCGRGPSPAFRSRRWRQHVRLANPTDPPRALFVRRRTRADASERFLARVSSFSTSHTCCMARARPAMAQNEAKGALVDARFTSKCTSPLAMAHPLHRDIEISLQDVDGVRDRPVFFSRGTRIWGGGPPRWNWGHGQQGRCKGHALCMAMANLQFHQPGFPQVDTKGCRTGRIRKNDNLKKQGANGTHGMECPIRMVPSLEGKAWSKCSTHARARYTTRRPLLCFQE